MTRLSTVGKATWNAGLASVMLALSPLAGQPAPGVTQPSAASWSVTLPNGAVVELTGLCSYPTGDHGWWRPDGSPLPESPIDSLTIKEDGRDLEPDSALLYKVAVRVSCDERHGRTTSQCFRFTPGRPFKWGRDLTKSGESVPDVHVAVVGFARQQQSMELAYVVGATDIKPYYGCPKDTVCFENVSLVPGLTTSVRTQIRTPAQRSDPPVVPDTVTFGPVVERVLSSYGVGKECFIDFESGKLFDPPERIRQVLAGMFERWQRLSHRGSRWTWDASERAFVEWVIENGIDAVADFDNRGGRSNGRPRDRGVPVLIGADALIVEPVNAWIADEHWRNAKAVATCLLRHQRRIKQPYGRARAVEMMPGHEAVLGVQTADGGHAVVRAAWLHETGTPQLRLRYKLVQGLPAAVVPDEPPLWFTLLPRSGTFRAFSRYSHSSRRDRSIACRAYAFFCDFEVRSATDQRRLFLCPDTDPAGSRAGSYLDRIGSRPDGLCLAAITRDGRRCSNVAELRIEADHVPERGPLLALVALPQSPKRQLPYLGIRATGPDPADPGFTNMAICFPSLVVDGILRKRSMVTWIGPVAPLKPGALQARILSLDHYEPPIEPAAKHEVKAVVGKYESATIVIPADDDNGRVWDEVTPGLPLWREREPVLRGTVIGPDGKPGSGYEVGLLDPLCGEPRHRERCATNGTFVFVSVPPGVYRLHAYPPGKGIPLAVVHQVRVSENQTLVRNLSLERLFGFSGRATRRDGTPVAGRTVMGTWRSPDGTAEFHDFAVTDAHGCYALSAPFREASYVGLSGTGPQPRPHHNVLAGRKDVDFSL